MAAPPPAVDARAYFSTYHGHDPAALRLVASALREGEAAAASIASASATAGDAPPASPPRRSLIWLAGDSSLDNKFWLRGGVRRTPACNGEERAFGLAEPLPQDVAHCVNTLLAARAGSSGGGGGGGAGASRLACVNAAVEESRLADRAGGRLLPQDEVLRDSLADGDVLVVSVGGNDIALSSSLATKAALVALLGLPLPSCCSALCPQRLGGASDAALEDGSALGLAHLTRLFGEQTRDYVRALLAGPQRARPALVVICMIYYPLQADVAGGEEGWADLALRLLGYDTDPARLQTAIRSLFARATSRIALDGVRVVACPLFNVLDPLKPSDYVARVEPSAQGAAKMAAAFVRIISENAAKVGAAGVGGSGTGGAARAAGAGEAL